MRRYLFLLTAVVFLFAFIYPRPEAKAMVDPVTIAILTPIAIQVGKAMLPYVLKGFVAAGKAAFKGGKEFLNFFRLPLGLFQCMCWSFKSGMKNLFLGFAAPFKMAFHFVSMPFVGFAGAFK